VCVAAARKSAAGEIYRHHKLCGSFAPHNSVAVNRCLDLYWIDPWGQSNTWSRQLAASRRIMAAKPPPAFCRHVAAELCRLGRRLAAAAGTILAATMRREDAARRYAAHALGWAAYAGGGQTAQL